MQGSAQHIGARAEREDARSRHLALGTSSALTLAVLVAFFGVAVAYLLDDHLSPVRFTAGIATLLLVYAVQLAHSFAYLSPRLTRLRYWTFGLQILLTYLPFLTFADAWLATPGFLAGSALLVLPPHWMWPTFAAIVGSSSLLVLGSGVGRGSLLYGTVATTLTGLVVFGLSELTRLVQEAHRTRIELTRMAVEAERLRLSRDLHDLLGMSLTTIAFKCELARRLPASKHARVQQELTEILETTQRAFTEVRAVSQTYRAMSLATEVDTVFATLRSMGVDVEFAGSAGPLPPDIETTLATVLREGVTNMLRHSRVGTCVVRLQREQDAVRLTVANDGLDDRPAAAFSNARPGSGLNNLRDRIEAVEGRLTTEVKDGMFSLTAVVPVPAEAPAPRHWLVRPLYSADRGVHDSTTVA
ncbi:sensor histidine kinase [Streptomyces capoamus]|uniref:sensor histidine kinase n=1 Tax=Streptomyces capoamus TaxID=68183 RepID=UPI0033975FF6